MVTGSVALAAYAHEVAQELRRQHRAAHRPLPEGQARRVRPAAARDRAERVKAGGTPLFQSHMWDGSAVPLTENLEIAQELLALTQAAHIILEIEIGVVGGEEDGVANEINEKLYTTVEDGLATVEALGLGENGRYMAAADLRQRARRLQAGQRQAPPRDPQGDPGRGRRQVRQGQAVRPRLPRRLRLAARGDRRGGRLRRHQDEHRHRHPVRVHPPGRRPHVQELRRRAQGRRRGRQQEGRTTRAPGARPPRPAWPPASSRRARTCAPPAPRSSNSLPQPEVGPTVALPRSCRPRWRAECLAECRMAP